jgi:predicted permease
MTERGLKTFARPWLWLVELIGVIVPRRLRADWRQEWEAELRYRETLLAAWDKLERRAKLALLWHSLGAFADALWLQPRRLEDEMFQDLRYGARMLLKKPGFTAIAVLTLALGIGANTAIFTVLDKVLIKMLPVPEPDRLVRVVSRGAQGVNSSFSQPLYADYRDRGGAFVSLAAHCEAPLSLSDGAQTDWVPGLIVSGNYFDVLGVTPALGRTFLPEEDRAWGAHPVIVVSHGLWRRRYGADPRLIGRSVRLNGHNFTVVGVAPPEFTGAVRGSAPDIYVPLMMAKEARPKWVDGIPSRAMSWLSLIGRLKPGVTREQASTALSVAAAEFAKAYSESADPQILLEDGGRGEVEAVRDLNTPLKLLMAAVGLVLLIACANVANLLLARAAGRRREIAVRLAVGAGRFRIVRQLLTESVLLAGLGGALGLLVAVWLANWLTSFSPPGTNFAADALTPQLDWRALGFAATVSMLTGALFGVVPALAASKPDLIPALKDEIVGAGAGRRLTLKSFLVIAQVALSLLVLAGAGLCVRSLWNLMAIDAGFEPSQVVVMSFDLGHNRYSAARGKQFQDELLARTKALPGVEAASFARKVPLGDDGMRRPFDVEGYTPRPGESAVFDFNIVGPDYFRTMKAPIVRGREFTTEDAPGAKEVVVINEAAARAYWPGQDPIGKRLIIPPMGRTPARPLEIVGVATDSKYRRLTEDTQPCLFLPLLQHGRPDLTLHVRAAGDAGANIAAVRKVVYSLDPYLPIFDAKTMEEQKRRSLSAPRLAALLLGGFGALALGLAALGLYGVMSYTVAQRAREIGVRMALGARPLDALTLVMKQGMMLTLAGVAIGLGASFALTRLMKTLLFGVSATDPLTFALIATLLAVVALLACYIPARRATKVDPLVALRHE